MEMNRSEVMLLVSMFVMAIGWTSASTMFPKYNRPAIFRNETIWFITNLCLFGGGIVMIMWGLGNILFWKALLIIVVGILMGLVSYPMIPQIITQSVIAPIGAAIALGIMIGATVD